MMPIASTAAATEIARDLNITLPDSLDHVASVFDAKRELVVRIAGMPFDRAARLLMLHVWQREPLAVASLSLALLAEIQERGAQLKGRDALIAEKDVLIEELRASLDIRVGRRSA